MEEISLKSGNVCLLVKPRVSVIKNYRILFYPESQGTPSISDQEQMLCLSLHYARKMALARNNDSEQHMIIHNGLGARRKRNFHYHIIPVAGRVEKTMVYFWLFLKNIFHPIWLLSRKLRRKLIHET